MFALQIVLAGATLAAGVAARALTSPADSHLVKRLSSGCSTSGSASCHNTTKETDLCCFEAPGGLLVQTQFWDTNPVTGPANAWTIHGLWPDHCDGTFSENCDSSRDYTGISSLLTAQGASSTLQLMNEFWINDPNDGTNEEFWEHEWATHGTCYSTLQTSCLPSGSAKGAEAVAFFQTVVKLYQTLPTYQWLAQAGITPSTSKTYTLSQITSALKSIAGVTPAFDCSSGALSQVYWYFNLKGSLIDGEFVPIDAPSAGSCGSGALKYTPKVGATTTVPTTTGPTSTSKGSGTTSTVSSPSPTTTGTLPAKATISGITSSGATLGGLLSLGTWSVTPGTYTLSGTTSSFTMTSSKGSCGVSSGTFSCGSGVSSTFSAISSGGKLLLASGGSTAFSSDASPSGNAQETVFTGSSHTQTYTLSIVST